MLQWQVFGDPVNYSLSLAVWGSMRDRWVQTTRRGFNLVLQLNFSPEHDQYYRRHVDPEGLAPFVYRQHPVTFGKRNTMAWSRMDIDLRTGIRQPPKSLYGRLPRKFCFRDVDERPAFLRNGVRTNCSKKTFKAARFQMLDYA